MQLGMIGLGRMGANMVRRLMRDGHSVVVYARTKAPSTASSQDGVIGAYIARRSSSSKLETPRAVWLMVPAASSTARWTASCRCSTRATSSSTAATRYYHDDIRRADELDGARASTTSTSAPAAASGGSSAATA